MNARRGCATLVQEWRLFMDDEQREVMNKRLPTGARWQERRLLEGAAKIVQDFGLAWKVLEIEPEHGELRSDATVEISDNGRRATFVVEIKPRLRTAQAGALVAQLRRYKAPGLLLAPYVNPELAENLRRHDVCFLDLAGNAYLRGDGLLIWVIGRKNTQKVWAERETRRAFKPTGLKVIFALLCDPELVEKDYRTLAEVAGVALGTVQWVMRDLVQEGYVLRMGHTTRRLTQLERLLDQWALGFARELQPRLLLGRFETRDFGRWREVGLAAHQAAWGGEAAAALMTGYLKPETLTIWVDRPAPRLLAELGLRPAENGRVQLRQVFWTPALAAQGADASVRWNQTATAQPTVPPALVYAELLAIGDARTLETAERIRNEWIDRPFQLYRARTAR